MAIVSNSAFVEAIRHFKLLDGEQLSDLIALAGGSNADVGGISKALVQRGWLSAHQVHLVLAGQAAKLFFGPYVLLDVLSKNGQSEVYKARHSETGWIVALKVIRRESVAAPTAVSQFFLEMQTIAELEHPNVIQLLDADKIEDCYYCAMEFVDGTNLDTLVQVKGQLQPELAAEYVRQAALGLQCAHEHNLIHGVIRPANLLLARQTTANTPVIKILDWGKVPQQPVDMLTDIHDLGCTLCYLLTGVMPAAGKQVADATNTETAPELANIVKRMMAKQPSKRYQTAAAVAMALKPYCRGDKWPNATLRQWLQARCAVPAIKCA